MTAPTDAPASAASAPAVSGPAGSSPTAPGAPRRVREQALPRRRNTRALAVGIAVAAAGAAGCLLVVSGAGHKTGVVVLTHDIPFGTRLGGSDLAVTKVALDPAVHSMPAAELSTALGQRTTGALHGGSLLTDQDISVGVQVPAGKALVGLSLGSGQIPRQDLASGAPLSLVIVPDSSTVAAGADSSNATSSPSDGSGAAVSGGGAAGTGTAGQVQKVITGTLESLGETDQDGRIPVDVLVASTDSPDLAAAAAAQRVVVVALPVQ